MFPGLHNLFVNVILFAGNETHLHTNNRRKRRSDPDREGRAARRGRPCLTWPCPSAYIRYALRVYVAGYMSSGPLLGPTTDIKATVKNMWYDFKLLSSTKSLSLCPLLMIPHYVGPFGRNYFPEILNGSMNCKIYFLDVSILIRRGTASK